MSHGYKVALAGFTPFERNALTSCFRLMAGRTTYAEVGPLAQADFIVADADHPGVIRAVERAHREADTVFVGSEAPADAMLWLMRPVDPMHIVRDLDSMVALRQPLRMPPTPVTTATGRCAPPRHAADSPMRRASDHDAEGDPADGGNRGGGTH